jgi:hypothetical protein
VALNAYMNLGTCPNSYTRCHLYVLGDLNEGPAVAGSQAPNLAALFEYNSPLIDCYSLPGFDLGNRAGTFDSCGLRNRLDYIFISQSLQPYYTTGRVFRKGLWGSRVTRPTRWETYIFQGRSFGSFSGRDRIKYLRFRIPGEVTMVQD